MKNNIDQGVESLRGVAILLIVAAHVIGSHEQSGMKVDPNSVWEYVYGSLKFIRVPLFTMISGFIFALRPIDAGSFLKFVRGKVRRLIFPLITVGTFQFILRVVVPSVNNPCDIRSIWRIYLYPFDHFWFLQSLFLIFIVVVIIEILKGIDSFLVWTFFMAFSIFLLFMSSKVTSLLGVSGAFSLFTFFMFGIGLKRFSILSRSSRILYLSILFLTIGVILIQLNIGRVIKINEDVFKYVEMFPGLALGLILFRFRKKNAFLEKIGSFAFPIYLFHIIISSAIRILFVKSGIHSDILIFVFSFSGGIIFSIIVTIILRKYFLSRRLLLGER
jgi:fucose 4-O-acetylase-like acetyltransferase